MDETRKAEIRLRAEAATPPPWHGIENNPIDDYWAAANPEDADFIAYARQDVPDLLTALDAAEQRAKELDLANYDVTQNNRGLWDELTVAEQRAAEAEVLISQLLDPNQNEFTIEKTFLALKKWLEEHGPHEHG